MSICFLEIIGHILDSFIDKCCFLRSGFVISQPTFTVVSLNLVSTGLWSRIQFPDISSVVLRS